MIKVSILIPTTRNFEHYAKRVIDSITAAEQLFDYEILILSKEQIDYPKVRWIKEYHQLGGVYAINYLAHHAEGEYIYSASDDHVVSNNFFHAVEFIENNYKDKKYKITSVQSGSPCYLKACPDFPKLGLLPEFLIMRFPVVHQQTIYEQLNGFIFHPYFRNHSADCYLGFFLGMNHQKGVECPVNYYNFARQSDSYPGPYHIFNDYETLINLALNYRTGKPYVFPI